MSREAKVRRDEGMDEVGKNREMLSERGGRQAGGREGASEDGRV